MNAPAIPQHQHGTITGYFNGCRQECCRAAQRDRTRDLRRDRAYGRQRPGDRMPAAPSRDLLRDLRDRGYGTTEVSKLTGLADQQIGKVRDRGCKFVSRETAERIFAAYRLCETKPPAKVVNHVHPIGARRRIQALMAIGWPLSALQQMPGGASAQNALYEKNGRTLLTVRAAQDIADLFERLSMTPGPSRSARMRAAGKGWPTPLELDDDRIDDPTYSPTLHRPDAVTARREAREERERLIREMTAKGHSAREVAQVVGLSTRSVVRALARLQVAS